MYLRTAKLIAASCGIMALLARTVCRHSISSSLPWVPDWRSYPSVSPSRFDPEFPILNDAMQRGCLEDTPKTMRLAAEIDIESIQFTAQASCSISDLTYARSGWGANFFPAGSPSVLKLWQPRHWHANDLL